MPSYTTSLRLIQPTTGEYPGTWGTQVNDSLTAVVDKAVAGTATITMTAANYILTNGNGVADEAKAMFLVLGGTPGGTFQVICPAVSKLYFVTNNTGFAQTVKTSAGTGISVPNGARMTLYCDGTNVVAGENYLASLSLGAALPTASGGTGLTSFTANGVAYASSSSALTTSSGLTFDGTNFATTGTGAATKFIPTGGAATGNGMYLPATNTLAFSTNGTEALRIDASRNLGLDGTSPSAWFGYKALQSGQSSLYASGTTIGISSNSYFATAGTSWTRISAITTARYEVSSGVHKWFTDVSGAAGGSFTPTERMQLTNAGDLLVGLSAATFVSTRLEVQAATNNNALGAKTTQNNYAPLMAWNSATTGDNLFQYFYTEGALTLRGSIDYNRAGGLVRYNTTSDYRAKDIIAPVQNPGATIDALKVYEGVMKGATQSRPMLIAHEAQEHAPYAVSGVKDEVNEDGTPKFQQIDVSSLVPLLLAEIQSLRARVAALEAK